MNALVLTEFGKVELREIAAPRAGPGEVVLRVAATGICGSDLHGFLGLSPRRQPGLVLGHETHGRVHELGEGVDGAWRDKRVSVNPLVSCGRCEMCRQGRQNVCLNWYLIGLDRVPGAMAEFVAVPARNLLELPEGVDAGAAVMIEPLANAVHLIAMAPPHAGLYPSAAIWGAGTLGIAILSVARARGIRVVAVVETNPRRGEVARTLGAETVLDPRAVDAAAEIRRLTGGRGVDLGIEAVGIAATRQSAAAALVRGGTALLLGIQQPETAFDFTDLVRREIRLQCSYGFTNRDFQEAFDLVAGGRVDLRRWIEILPLARGQEGFERLHKDPGDRVKLALQP